MSRELAKIGEAPLLYTVKATARLLSLSERSIEYAVAAGQLEAVRLGRRLLIKRASIERFAELGGPLSMPLADHPGPAGVPA